MQNAPFWRKNEESAIENLDFLRFCIIFVVPFEQGKRHIETDVQPLWKEQWCVCLSVWCVEDKNVRI